MAVLIAKLKDDPYPLLSSVTKESERMGFISIPRKENGQSCQRNKTFLPAISPAEEL